MSGAFEIHIPPNEEAKCSIEEGKHLKFLIDSVDGCFNEINNNSVSELLYIVSMQVSAYFCMFVCVYVHFVDVNML